MNTLQKALLSLSVAGVAVLGVAMFNGGNTVVTEVVKDGVPLGAVVGPDYYEPFRFHSSVGYKELVIAPTASTTLVASQSGATVVQSADAEGDLGLTLVLPPVTQVGANFKFVVGAAFGTDNLIIDSAEGDNIQGALIVAGAVVDCDAEDQINFVADGENLGDFVELYSDGTSWHIGASGGLTSAKITCTDPS